MKYFQRQVRLVALLALFLMVPVLHAQDTSSVTLTGSNIVIPLVQQFAEASATGIAITAEPTGTTEGINRLCAGTADMVATTRPLSVDEDTACTNNGVNYIELLIGHDILAFITQPTLEFAQCFTQADLNTLFAPSMTARTTNWTALNAENTDTPLSVVIPNPDSSLYLILDRLVEGDGIRSDATFQTSDAEIITTVQNTPGAIGIVSLPAAQAAGDTVKILDLDGGDTGGCNPPTVENVEGRLYGGATRLFLYVNSASRTKTAVNEFLTFVGTDATQAIVSEGGFAPASTATYEQNRAILEGADTGRTFSEEVVDFSIPADVFGTVTIGGAAQPYTYLQGITNSFSGIYPGVTITYNIEGQTAGFRRLCNGELSIVMAYGDMTAEQLAACEANGVITETIRLGTQAVVLVSNANTPFLTCLTTDQLKKVWNSATEAEITSWNQVDGSFADTKLTLFTPRLSDTTTDLLMARINGIDVPMRNDTEISFDALYRAAATANVEGGLTFMSWRDYQRVLTNNQERIQLVSVDSGNGCVAPSPETFADGSYLFARPVQLVVSQSSLQLREVQSVLWYIFTDENFNALDAAGFVGIVFGDLPEIRQNLQRAFTDAQNAALAPEATPEPGAELTPEATASADAESTAEATEAAPEDTSEATSEATPEATASS